MTKTVRTYKLVLCPQEAKIQQCFGTRSYPLAYWDLGTCTYYR